MPSPSPPGSQAGLVNGGRDYELDVFVVSHPIYSVQYNKKSCLMMVMFTLSDQYSTTVFLSTATVLFGYSNCSSFFMVTLVYCFRFLECIVVTETFQ